MSRPKLKDVAEKAGVSAATASYVLNHKKKYISDETKRKVFAAAKELGYVPDMNARGLAARDTRLIGVVIPQREPGSALMFRNSFYSEILGSIEYQARIQGYQIIISGTNVDEDYIRLAKERNLDGVIAIGIYPDGFYEQFREIGIPVVLVDSCCEGSMFHNIKIDDMHGGYLAAKYMLERGHREIGFLSETIGQEGVMKERLLGYQKALQEFGVPFREEYIYEGRIEYENGVRLAEKIADENPDLTGVIATADVLAIGAVKGFHNRGIHVPDDISVIGFDDLEISKYMTPGLTTVKQDVARKGERAVDLLLQNIRDDQMPAAEEILPVTIAERESVKVLQQDLFWT